MLTAEGEAGRSKLPHLPQSDQEARVEENFLYVYLKRPTAGLTAPEPHPFHGVRQTAPKGSAART